jgi:KEOPS complex subunit Cgi121
MNSQGITMNDRIVDQHNFMNHNIQIAGFGAEINDLTKLIDFTRGLSEDGGCEMCTIQLLHAKGIAGEKHVLQATLQALKAFYRNKNTAKDLGLEICVRASAQRQISRALKILGIKEGKIDICAVTIDCDQNIMHKLGEFLGKKRDKTLQADINALKELYGISNDEIKSAGNIERVLIERTALLSLEI